MSGTSTRLVWVLGAAGMLPVASGPVGAAESSTRRRPNILYIMTDQQPVSCVAAYGNPTLKTPNLDRLADSGCVLYRAYIAAFACSPSRASQLSGRYAHNHGVLRNDVLFDAAIPCLGDVCKAAGYDTAYFGKWHLGGNMYRHPKRKQPTGVGERWFYQRVESEEGFKFKPVAGGFGEDEPQHGFDTWVGGWEHYRAYLQKVGLGELLEQKPALGNHQDAPSGPEGKHIHSLIPEEHHMASFLARRAERFIRERAMSSRPWCAVLSFYGPHLPVAPPKPWDTMYALDQIALPDNHHDGLEGKPAGQRNNRRCYRLGKWSDDQFKDYIRRYWGYCSYIDAQIGGVLTALRDTDQWDRTIILFTSDHGDMLGTHGMVFKLGSCGYEELYRVPAILSIPGVTRPGSRTDALVSNVDFLPTLLEASQIPIPERTDGKSLAALLKGETTRHRDAVFADHADRSFICRDDHHKFVLNCHDRDANELYDLQTDPGELKNLAYVTEYKALADKMTQRILTWLRETKHPYADIIAEQAVKKPQATVLEIGAKAAKLRCFPEGKEAHHPSRLTTAQPQTAPSFKYPGLYICPP